ncbi:hypothetical protein J437_LFUL004838 [Ladona fulva]|uniref:PiggyBac transposable element-derived protein domain-containing protein n=1 Tax=Ladona fulva TaxID=123851 RepID=A0A8K0K2U3_LADFU|nr:hypothetical protein J437_LFUL004838 [Ladona fulva]
MEEDSEREDTDEVLVFAEKQIGDGEDCTTHLHVASPTLLSQPSTSKDTAYSTFEWSDKSPQVTEVPSKGWPGLKALHFSENPNEDEPVPTDRLYKIRPFLSIFEETMSEIYSPKRELCLDESMILWRGRLLFRAR